MRLPSGYGSVIKLGGKRRKPYAVRITVDYAVGEDGIPRQKYKYLEYFEKRKDAMVYLSNYNAGVKVKEHVALHDAPTFADVFNQWLDFRLSLKKGLSPQAAGAYKAAFNRMGELHGIKFQNVRTADLQKVISASNNMSQSTVANMMLVLHAMYKYAIANEIVEKDYSASITSEYEKSKGGKHTPFTDKEIECLWEHKEDSDVDIVFILIYTGMRCSELLTLENKDIHLEERYIEHGIKTKAGTNRKIPIAKKILPFISARYSPNSKYFYPNEKGTCYIFNDFYKGIWADIMERYGMEHKPHDARHTCSTLMEKDDCVPLLHRKLILGHKIDDLTERVYTHVSIEDLIADIDKI